MSDPDRVLVLGATGHVGAWVCRALALRQVPVRGFYLPAPGVEVDSEVEPFPGDLDDLSTLEAAMRDVHAVFMLTPPSPSQPRWHHAIVAAARHHGVERIVKLSAFDSGPSSVLTLGRWHADGERAIRESGLGWTVLRPQYFMQMLVDPMSTSATTGVLAKAAPGALRLGFVDVRDIADVAVACLISADHESRILVPTGPEALSFDELAALVSARVGRPIVYRQVPADDVRADLGRRGWPRWHIDDYLNIHGAAAGDLVTSDVLDVTGSAPRSFADLIDEHAPAWSRREIIP